jgi:hypothetical protein
MIYTREQWTTVGIIFAIAFLFGWSSSAPTTIVLQPKKANP